MNSGPHNCQVYLISPPEIQLEEFSIALSETLTTGIVSCFQLRLKGGDDALLSRAGETLLPICQNYDVPLIINDRPDLAAKLGADGVHIGVDDVSYREARRLVGDDAIVGVSCYNSRHAAMIAAEQGADYIAFGAFFPTATKTPRTRAELELLRWWQKSTTVPCVAIGGISVKNCASVIEAGADFIAIIGGVWNHPDGPSAALMHFEKLCSGHN